MTQSPPSQQAIYIQGLFHFLSLPHHTSQSVEGHLIVRALIRPGRGRRLIVLVTTGYALHWLSEEEIFHALKTVMRFFSSSFLSSVLPLFTSLSPLTSPVLSPSFPSFFFWLPVGVVEGHSALALFQCGDREQQAGRHRRGGWRGEGTVLSTALSSLSSWT